MTPAAKASRQSNARTRADQGADDVRFFETPVELRDWFAANHETADELWLGVYKVGSGRRTVTWPQAVDEALCFGWIDGIRRRIDDASYKNRFTPRRKGSNWSVINVRRVGELEAEGRMHAAGRREFEARRNSHGSGGARMTTSHVEVPGGRLLVVDEGDGPPIALLHAGIADIRSWDAMVPLLNDAGYRTIRYDQRGVGGSTTEDVAFSRVADLLAVLDAKGIDRAVLVGNSMGGMLSFDAAIEAPDRVVAIVGVGAGLGGFDGGNTPDELAMFREMERLEAEDPVDASAVADIDIRVWVDGPGQPPTRVPAAIRDLVHEMDLLDPSRPQGRPIRLDPPASARLAELRCPILAVAGEIDVSEVAVTARHLESNAPNARALVWPDVAHMIGMEQPERLTAAIVEFVAPLEPWR